MPSHDAGSGRLFRPTADFSRTSPALGEASHGQTPTFRARLYVPLQRLAFPAYTSHTRDVYDTCMTRVRTNIEIEDEYVRAIMDRFGVHTKPEAVDLALRRLAGQPMTATRRWRSAGHTPSTRSPTMSRRSSSA